MSDSAECRAIRALLPELGLDVLTGEERAAALHHLAACAACRRELDELREVADELLLLAPSREPPAGFESRVLERVGGRAPAARRPSGRRLLVTAAAVMLGALMSAAGLYLATGEIREQAGHYRDALEHAGGQYFGGIPLHDDRRERVGTVFGYEGAPTWLLVALDAPGDSGRYDVVLVTKERERLPVGSVGLRDGRGSWGRVIPVSLREVARVELVDEEGKTEFQSDLPP